MHTNTRDKHQNLGKLSNIFYTEVKLSYLTQHQLQNNNGGIVGLLFWYYFLSTSTLYSNDTSSNLCCFIFK